MKPTDFAHHLTASLTGYLAGQRQVSPHTIQAYRDVFVRFLRFCRDQYGVEPERLHLAQIDPDLIVAVTQKTAAISSLLSCVLSSIGAYERRVYQTCCTEEAGDNCSGRPELF
jgi:site-specific recombinase XerC